MFRIKNKGFSQVSLLVGVFFLAIVVAIVMKTIKKQNDNLKNILSEAEIINYTNKVKTYLSSPENCKASFEGISTDGGVVTSLRTIKDGLATKRFEVFAKSNKTIGSQKIKILEYKISSYDQDEEDISELGFLYLNISLKKNLDSLRASMAERQIRLYFFEEDGLLTDCAFGGLPSSNIIVHDRGDYNFIESSSISIKTNDGGAKLNVKDDLVIEDSKSACNNNTQGTIRYDQAAKKFMACLTPPNWSEVHK